jgi:hypothetical protein
MESRNCVFGRATADWPEARRASERFVPVAEGSGGAVWLDVSRAEVKLNGCDCMVFLRILKEALRGSPFIPLFRALHCSCGARN